MLIPTAATDVTTAVSVPVGELAEFEVSSTAEALNLLKIAEVEIVPVQLEVSLVVGSNSGDLGATVDSIDNVGGLVRVVDHGILLGRCST